MTLMTIFRFGQLGDYFTYYYLYTNPLLMRDPISIIYASFLNILGFDYQGFITITELICMGLAFPFFYKTCQRSCIALLVFYCYTWMLCPMSALRQAICLSLMLFSYPLLVEGKRNLFLGVVLFGSFIHLSFFSVLLIGIFYDKKWFDHPLMLYIVLLSTLLMFSGADLLSEFRTYFAEDRSVSFDEQMPFANLFQLFLRLLIILPIFLFKPDYWSNGYFAKSICIIGYILYCLLSADLLVAGRMEYFFRTFLCLFVAYLSFNCTSKFRRTVLFFFVLVHVILFFKNIGGAISQGDYKGSVTIFNYPYISIFDKQELEYYSTMEKYGYKE